jgi:hypothetical protein
MYSSSTVCALSLPNALEERMSTERGERGDGDIHELFHDPTLAERGIMFSTVDLLLTLADLALALCYAELAIENLFCTMTDPTWRCEGLFLDDFLDDGLGRRMHDLGGGCDWTDYG